MGFPGLLYVQVSFKSICLNLSSHHNILQPDTLVWSCACWWAWSPGQCITQPLPTPPPPSLSSSSGPCISGLNQRWLEQHFYNYNTFSSWSGTRGGKPWKEETLASVYLGRLDLKYLVLMYHFFSSKAGSLLWCGGWHILWYPPGWTDKMIFILHSHSSQKTWQERDWSARPSHVKVITSKTTMFAFQCL